MGDCRDIAKRLSLSLCLVVLSAALLVASGCSGSEPPAGSPTPSPSLSASVALTPEQFASAYLTERARAVLPGQPLSVLRRFALAGVPWLQRERLLATGRLLAEKARGRSLTGVDCEVAIKRVEADPADEPVSARVQADVTSTHHWTDADGHAGSDVMQLPHTVTIAVGNTKSGRWRVVNDEYADPDAPRLLTLARADPATIQAARGSLRAQDAALQPIAQAATEYWTSQLSDPSFLGEVAADGRYLRLLRQGSPDLPVQRYAVRGARRLEREFSGERGLSLLSVGIDEITVTADGTEARVGATCWFSEGAATKGWTFASVASVSQRTLVLRKAGERWLVWRDEYPPIADLMWSPIPVAGLREQLQRAQKLAPGGPLGRGLPPAPPGAVAAMEEYFASTDPSTFGGASRAAFVWAFTVPREPDGHRSTSTRLYLTVYYGAWGPVAYAGDMHPGYNGDFFLLTRPSTAAGWRVQCVYYP